MDAINNFVKVEVSTGYDNAATTVVLKAGDGAKLPDPAVANYNLVWYNSSDYADPADDPYVEIPRITGKSTDTLTVVRPVLGNAYNGETPSNTAQAHNVAGKTYKFVLAPTYKIFKDIDSAIGTKQATMTKAAGSDVNTGSDDSKYVTSKAIEDSDYIKAAALPVKATKAEAAAGTDDAKFLTALAAAALFGLPEGTLYNGKIVPVIADQELYMYIKGKDGNDPSATNPVYCMIDGALRSITATCYTGVQKGANKFNAGSTELATKELSFFGYLGYNATNGVFAGIGRIPYATLVSDFINTAASEKFLSTFFAITPAGGTPVVNIGRFAATQSAGAGYTWSVPTFTADNLIQRPIYESSLLLIAPAVSTYSGTLTSKSASGCYRVMGRRVFLQTHWVITTNGTGAVDVRTTAPFTAVATNPTQINGSGRQGVNGYATNTYIAPSSNLCCTTYGSNNAYPGGDGTLGDFNLVYEI